MQEIVEARGFKCHILNWTPVPVNGHFKRNMTR